MKQWKQKFTMDKSYSDKVGGLKANFDVCWGVNYPLLPVAQLLFSSRRDAGGCSADRIVRVFMFSN